MAKRGRPSEQRQLLMLALGLFLPALGVILGMILMDSLHQARCPTGTLFAGGIPGGYTTLALPLIALSFVWFLCQMPLVGAIRQGRLVGGHDPAVLRRWVNRGTIVAAGVSLLSTMNGAFAQFCALPDHIELRNSVFSTPKEYPWSSVRSLVASCFRTGGRNRTESYSYTVVMDDGQTIDLSYGTAPASTIVRAVGEALRNVPFAYDASRIHPWCQVYRELLLRRP